MFNDNFLSREEWLSIYEHMHNTPFMRQIMDQMVSFGIQINPRAPERTVKLLKDDKAKELYKDETWMDDITNQRDMDAFSSEKLEEISSKPENVDLNYMKEQMIIEHVASKTPNEDKKLIIFGRDEHSIPRRKIANLEDGVVCVLIKNSEFLEQHFTSIMWKILGNSPLIITCSKNCVGEFTRAISLRLPKGAHVGLILYYNKHVKKLMESSIEHLLSCNDEFEPNKTDCPVLFTSSRAFALLLMKCNGKEMSTDVLINGHLIKERFELANFQSLVLKYKNWFLKKLNASKMYLNFAEGFQTFRKNMRNAMIKNGFKKQDKYLYVYEMEYPKDEYEPWKENCIPDIYPIETCKFGNEEAILDKMIFKESGIDLSVKFPKHHSLCISFSIEYNKILEFLVCKEEKAILFRFENSNEMIHSFYNPQSNDVSKRYVIVKLSNFEDVIKCLRTHVKQINETYKELSLKEFILLNSPEKEKQQVIMKVCANCGKKEIKMKLCGRCRKVRYCSKECQIKDWKSRHKFVCK